MAYYSDDEYWSSDDEQGNEVEETHHDHDEFYQFGGKSLEEPKFDTNSFDYRVAKAIVNIHKKSKKDSKYSNWVENNLSHLLNLYQMSLTTLTIEEFFTFKKFMFNNIQSFLCACRVMIF